MHKYIKLKNGNTIHYLRFGGGKPLILLPSLWLTSKSYTTLGKQLGKYYEVYMPDLYKGKSSFSKRVANIGGYVVELTEFINQMHLKDYYLVGISFSGIVANKYVLNESNKPKKLLLISTTILPIKMKSQRINLLIGYLRLLYHNMFSTKGMLINLMWIMDGMGNALTHLRQTILEGLIASSTELEEIKTLPVSTKLIFAKNDEFIPFRVTKKLSKVKRLELEVVDEFHGWFFRREEELVQKIYKFFQ